MAMRVYYDSDCDINLIKDKNVLIVDRLFAAAELRLGGEKQQKVRIVRNDGSRS